MTLGSHHAHHECFLPRLAATALAVLGLFAVDATGATLAVGPGKACRFSTIQAAINASAQGDTITVDPAQAVYREKLRIDQESLTISACPCDATACREAQDKGTVINAVISGAGGADAPVLSITTWRGNFFSVLLDHLTIQDGHSGSIDGGGIHYDGSGELTLTHSTVFSNRANYGAGINFHANYYLGADLFIGHDTFITNNTATQSGGGLRVEGYGAKLHMTDKNTWIAFNEATHGLGGGIEVLSDAAANIASPGYANLAAIYANKASYGGGIATSKARIFLYTVDPLHPIALDNNTAYNTGGGIYLGMGELDSLLCLREFRLTNNIAKEGSALYSDTRDSFGSSVLINTHFTDIRDPCPNDSMHAVFCDPSVACNIVHGNDTFDVLNKNTPTNGATMLLQSGTFFDADRLDVRDNRGGYALRVLGTDDGFSDVSVSNGLFAHNEVAREMVLASDGHSHLKLDNCLFARNKIGANRVIAATDVLALNNSIIDQGAIPALAFTGGASNLDNEFNIAGNIAGLIPTPTIIQGTPTYADAANGDFKLFVGMRAGVAVRSLGVDFAPAAGGGDIRNWARDKQVTTTPLFGPRDLGPYELQPFETQ